MFTRFLFHSPSSSSLFSPLFYSSKLSFYSCVSVFGKGKNTKDPFTSKLSPKNIGEDSYYLIENKEKKLLSFGVCDGVGGWCETKEGKPDLIAQEFMKHCKILTNEYLNRAIPITPSVASQIIFAQAYERLQHNPPGIGTTTGTIMNITPHSGEFDYLINTHFIGDSSFTVLRKDTKTNEYNVILKPVCHRMGDVPFQFGCGITPKMEKEGYVSVRPGEGIPACIKANKHDILLLATDGVWDNLTLDEITTITNEIPKDSSNFTDIYTKNIMTKIMNNWKKYDDVTMIAVQL